MRFLPFLLFLTITFLACKPSNPFVYTPISNETVIDTQEQEFVFEKPFKPKKQVNELCFEYTENLKIDSITNPPKFADGTRLVITSYLLDQNGERWETNSITRNGENYICFTPENYNEWLDISKTNVSFVKLITKSNPKIKVTKIEWKSYNSWDMK